MRDYCCTLYKNFKKHKGMIIENLATLKKFIATHQIKSMRLTNSKSPSKYVGVIRNIEKVQTDAFTLKDITGRESWVAYPHIEDVEFEDNKWRLFEGEKIFLEFEVFDKSVEEIESDRIKKEKLSYRVSALKEILN